MHTSYSSYFEPRKVTFADANFDPLPTYARGPLIPTERSLAAAAPPYPAQDVTAIVTIRRDAGRKTWTKLFCPKLEANGQVSSTPHSLLEILYSWRIGHRTPLLVFGYVEPTPENLHRPIPFLKKEDNVQHSITFQTWEVFRLFAEEALVHTTKHFLSGQVYSAEEIANQIMANFPKSFQHHYQSLLHNQDLYTVFFGDDEFTKYDGWPDLKFKADEIDKRQTPLAHFIRQELTLLIDEFISKILLKLRQRIPTFVRKHAFRESLPLPFTDEDDSGEDTERLLLPLHRYANQVLEDIGTLSSPEPAKLKVLYMSKVVMRATEVMLRTIGLELVGVALRTPGFYRRDRLPTTVLAIPSCLVESELIIMQNLNKNYGNRVFTGAVVDRLNNDEDSRLRAHTDTMVTMSKEQERHAVAKELEVYIRLIDEKMDLV